MNRMLLLIELYDRKTSIDNYMSCKLLNPDELVLITTENEEDQKTAQEHFENFKRYFHLKTNAAFLHVNPDNLMAIADRMKAIIRSYGEEHCVIDIIGGNETLLVASGICAAAYPKLRILTQKGADLVLIHGDDPDNEIGNVNKNLYVKEMISMAAGELLRCGHADWRSLNETTVSLIPIMFDIYMRNRGEWASFVYYLQHLNNAKYKVREGMYSGPLEFTVNPMTGKKVKANFQILNELSDEHIISACRITAVNCSLTFSHSPIIRFLCDPGSWLELYIFSVLRRSGLFFDIEINPVISWDNDDDDDDTINEVDLIATKGMVPFFISCKSGIPTNDAVNELAAIKNRFGNCKAQAVLVTACIIDRDAPSVNRRARDCGVEIIDAAQLNEKAVKERMADLLEKI